jgi:hypothetical protein
MIGCILIWWKENGMYSDKYSKGNVDRWNKNMEIYNREYYRKNSK